MTKKISIHIRSATLDDQDAITSLFRETVLNINIHDYSQTQVNAWADRHEKTHHWSDRIKHQYFLVAEHKGKVLGFGSITSDGYIDTLFIHKNYQDKGIGTKLLNQLLSYVVEKGRTVVHLDASLTARSFFEKNGFRMTRPQQKVIDGVVFVNFMMVKELTN